MPLVYTAVALEHLLHVPYSLTEPSLLINRMRNLVLVINKKRKKKKIIICWLYYEVSEGSSKNFILKLFYKNWLNLIELFMELG